MENKNYLIFLFISVLALPLLTATPTMSPPAPPQTLSENPQMSPEQLHNIIEAIMGANDFRSWADILTAPDPSTFPMTATFFIPTDDAVQSMATSLNRSDFDSSIILYHIVPQELTFDDLLSLPIGYRLATLSGNNSILVTNNTISNFTIDDCLITHPDVIINGAFSVQGIGSVLNSTAYGGQPLHQSPDSDIPKGFSSPIGNVLGLRHSGAPSFFAEFPVILLVCCAVFVFKIQESDLLIDGLIGL